VVERVEPSRERPGTTGIFFADGLYRSYSDDVHLLRYDRSRKPLPKKRRTGRARGGIEAAYVGGKQKWETIGPSRREAERALTARKREVDTNRARSLRHRPLGTGRRRPERRDARRPRPRLERAGGFLRDTEGLRVDPRRS
jgi:hypothetical protein